MKTPIHGQPEHVRRQRQRAIGLDITQPTTERRTDVMQETTVQPQQQPRRHPNQHSRAQQVLEHLTVPPSYKEVALHELKRASVYVPMVFTAVFGALWVNKKLIAKAATGL